jgi:hypothetical protein
VAVEKSNERKRKQRERNSRLPTQVCGIDGCEYQTKYTKSIRKHHVAVHGIGGPEALEELERKLPTQYCGIDGCEYQTKYTSNLRKHHVTVHGIGGPEALEELRRKKAELRDSHTKRKAELHLHQAAEHGIVAAPTSPAAGGVHVQPRRPQGVFGGSPPDNPRAEQPASAAEERLLRSGPTTSLSRPLLPGSGVEVLGEVARRGKVRWGPGAGTWWDVVEERAGVWVFVDGRLKVAKGTLKTLVCHDRDAIVEPAPLVEDEATLPASGEIQLPSERETREREGEVQVSPSAAERAKRAQGRRRPLAAQAGKRRC